MHFVLFQVQTLVVVHRMHTVIVFYSLRGFWQSAPTNEQDGNEAEQEVREEEVNHC